MVAGPLDADEGGKTQGDRACVGFVGGEKMLEEELRSLGINSIDVLKVSHHGSKNASGQELLNLLKPELAVISCGKNNVSTTIMIQAVV